MNKCCSMCPKEASCALANDLNSRFCAECLLFKLPHLSNKAIPLAAAEDKQLIGVALESLLKAKKELSRRGRTQIAFISSIIKTLSVDIDQKISAVRVLEEDKICGQNLKAKILEIGMVEMNQLEEQPIRELLTLFLSFKNKVEMRNNAKREIDLAYDRVNSSYQTANERIENFMKVLSQKVRSHEEAAQESKQILHENMSQKISIKNLEAKVDRIREPLEKADDFDLRYLG